MKQIKKIISIFVCVLLLFVVFILPNYIYTDVYAEENTENMGTAEFETLETQILNSERWCNAPAAAFGLTPD